jgi:hypothetical protein
MPLPGVVRPLSTAHVGRIVVAMSKPNPPRKPLKPRKAPTLQLTIANGTLHLRVRHSWAWSVIVLIVTSVVGLLAR